jgi:hypothetical protein
MLHGGSPLLLRLIWRADTSALPPRSSTFTPGPATAPPPAAAAA